MPNRFIISHRKTAMALAVLICLAIPVPHQIVPAWPLRLIDQHGIALGGIATTQTWRHLVYQPRPMTETRRSDTQGRLSFPERVIWGSGLRYLYGVVANIAQHGTDAAFGPDVWVYAKADADFGGSNIYTSGQAPPDTVVLLRYGVCPATNSTNDSSPVHTPTGKQAGLADLRVLKPSEDGGPKH